MPLSPLLGSSEIATLLLDIKERLAIVETQQTFILRSDVLSTDSRSKVHDKLDLLSSEVTELTLAVNKMEPIVKDYEKSKHRAVGFFLAVGVLASSVGYFVSEIKDVIFGKK